MTIYKFSNYSDHPDEPVITTEMEVTEHECSYTIKHTRILKSELYKLKGHGFKEMYCLENRPDIFIKAMINDINHDISELENEISGKKTQVDMWKKMLTTIPNA